MFHLPEKLDVVAGNNIIPESAECQYNESENQALARLAAFCKLKTVVTHPQIETGTVCIQFTAGLIGRHR